MTKTWNHALKKKNKKSKMTKKKKDSYSKQYN